MIVYIAGPYAAPTPAEIARNVRRAVALGRYAAHLGHTPIVPHAQGWAGVYGAASEEEPGVRELALRCSRELAVRADQVWAIQVRGGALSEGTRIETTAHVAAGGTVTARTWEQWCSAAAEHTRPVSLSAWAAPPVSTTLATALDVALDLAEDTGVYSERLRQRVADVVPALDLVGPWGVLEADGRREARYDLGERSEPKAEIVCEEDGRWSSWVDGPGWLSGSRTVSDDARRRCDDLLREQGRVLVGDSVRPPWRPGPVDENRWEP